MKKLFLILVLFTGLQVRAQVDNDTANIPYWWSMMQDNSNNFFSTQSAFEKYWNNHTYQGQSGYKVFKRWEWYWKNRINEDGTFPDNENVINEFKKFKRTNSTRSANGQWVEIGPRNLPANNTGQPNGMGRVNAIAFHPTNANIIFAGAPQGGLWKTTDGGSTWAISGTDQLLSLGVSSIAIDANDANIMYIGTGDRDANDAQGIGVYKSINGGVNWTASNTGITTSKVSRIRINPLNSNIIVIATSTGIYKSYNAGVTWTRKSTVNNHYKELVYKPGDTTVMYATENGNFYRSTNAGETWTNITSGLGSGNTRMVIAVTPSKSNMVYVVACNVNRRFQGFYVSNNSGLNFTTKSTAPNILGSTFDGSDNKGQGEYDLALSVNISNPNTVFVGGINVFRSNDTGATWACAAHWYGDLGLPEIHADQHIFEINPLNNILYAGNDGGMYYTANNGTSWIDRSSGMGIGQLYKIGQNPLNPLSIMNGFQDNGTALYNGTFSTIIGGDGMECIIDYQDTTVVYGALYYGDIRRKIGAGPVTTVCSLTVNGMTESGDWVTPYVLNPSNTNTMIVGMKNLWRTNTIKGTPAWSAITAYGGSETIRSMTYGKANNNNFFFYRYNSPTINISNNILAASPNFYTVATPNASPTSIVKDIETHPTDSNRIYIVQGNKVYRSTNKGANWVDISSNLPNISMNTIEMDKYSKEGLYVGTDAGVYYKDSTMANWILYSTGLPLASAITDLEFYYHPLNNKLSRISAGTYGRGVWQSDLYSSTTQPLVNYYASDSAPCVGVTITLNNASTPATDFNQWTITPGTYTLMNATTLNSASPQVKFNAPGNYTITLFGRSYGNGYDTTVKTNYIKVSSASAVSISVPTQNNFCVGDSTYVIATGAANYSWTPAIACSSPSTAGTYLKPTANTTYIVTGSFGGLCIDTESVTITVKPSPTVGITGVSTICNKQSTTLTATTTSGTINWSPNTNLNTTTGTVVVANPTSNITYQASAAGLNGCIGYKNYPITVNPRPTIQVSGNKLICVGGSTVLTASNAGNYIWLGPNLSTQVGAVTTANPSSLTQYTVIGNNAFLCYDTLKFNIDVLPSANVTIIASSPSICLGDTATFNLKGCITYTINPNAFTSFKNDSTILLFPNTVSSTTYTIEGTISPTCKDTKAQQLVVNAVPTVGLSATKTTILKGQTTTLTATGADNYTWSPSSTLSSSSGSSVVATPLDTTTYTVIGKNTFLCSDKKTIKIIVNKPTGISNSWDKLISIYPNPAKNFINISLKEGARIKLFNSKGQLVMDQTYTIGTHQMDVSHLSNGNYLLHVSDKQNHFTSYKINIEQ